MSEIVVPYSPSTRPRHAQLARKIVFYKHVASGRLTAGFPEEFPAPKCMEKIVCNHASEVERYSAIMRQQEKELFEAPIRAEHRQELQRLAANARNQLNRDFCLFALKKLDEADERGKLIRESYMHVEAFEEGK